MTSSTNGHTGPVTPTPGTPSNPDSTGSGANSGADTSAEQLTGDLGEAWRAVLGTSEGAQAAVADLLARYAEPHRVYHGLNHLSDVLERIDEIGGEADDEGAVVLAAFFHDAVYEPLAGSAVEGDGAGPDNEERSARLAESALSAVGAGDRVTEVVRLVRLTRTHAPDRDDRNGGVLCDADLAVLGSSPADYGAYAAAVREEYRAVDDDAFAAGRSAILRALLERPAIFWTQLGYERWEARARRNLDAELTLLAASTG